MQTRYKKAFIKVIVAIGVLYTYSLWTGLQPRISFLGPLFLALPTLVIVNSFEEIVASYRNGSLGKRISTLIVLSVFSVPTFMIGLSLLPELSSHPVLVAGDGSPTSFAYTTVAVYAFVLAYVLQRRLEQHPITNSVEIVTGDYFGGRQQES